MLSTIRHNPNNNAALINTYFEKNESLAKMVAETDRLFFESATKWEPSQQKESILTKIKSIWSKTEEPMKIHHTIVGKNGVYPDWKATLDKEWDMLQEKAKKEVYV